MSGNATYRRYRLVAAVTVAVAALVAVGAGLAQTTGSSQRPQQQPPAGSGKVTICHKGRNTLSVSVNAWPAHEAHGDARGACAPGTAAKPKPSKGEDDEDETDERSANPHKAKPSKAKPKKPKPAKVEQRSPGVAPYRPSERPAMEAKAKTASQGHGKPSWAGPPASHGNGHGVANGQTRGRGGK